MDSKGLIYLNAPESGVLIKVYNEQGEEVSDFGELVPERDSMLQVVLSYVYMSIDEDDYLYLSFINIPLIRKYSSDGTLIWERNIGNLPEIKKMFSILQRKRAMGQRYNILTLSKGTYFADPYFFVLFNGVIPYGNTVYAFNKNDGKLEKILRISRGDQPIESLEDHCDVAIDPEGNLWLISDQHKIVKFEKGE